MKYGLITVRASARVAPCLPPNVVVDLSAAHIWDASTVAALDAITTKYESRGTTVDIVGMNDSSRARHDALAGHLASAH